MRSFVAIAPQFGQFSMPSCCMSYLQTPIESLEASYIYTLIVFVKRFRNNLVLVLGEPAY